MKKEMNNKGFSLVELIIVIAIMAVLMGVLAPQFIKYVENSRIQKDESAAGEVVNAAKIALSIESIYKNCPDSTSIGVAHQTLSCGYTSLYDEITKTINPNEIVLSSKKHGGDTYTISIVYNSGSETYTVAGQWP